MKEHIVVDGHTVTDGIGQHYHLSADVAYHGVVHHVRKDCGHGHIQARAIKGRSSTLNRGIQGFFQYITKQRLYWCLVGFDFRYNTRVALAADENVSVSLALADVLGARVKY